MAKIKALLPSLKEKKRYLAFDADKPVQDLSRECYKQAHTFLGDLGMAHAGIVPLPTEKGALWKVNHTAVNHTKAALTMIQNIHDQEVCIRSLGVSGILQKAQAFLER
ncbi:hypothetical protein J4410_04720 [Candidatus Woesearchaeota archaeon]|nr:hypothetical protein [Candidatus Woesearchaeota archaeon]